MIVRWFSDILLKLNDENCYLMIFGNKSKDTIIKIGKSEIKDSNFVKLLGITFDKKLNVRKHIEGLCRKASQETHALARLSNYLDTAKSELLKNAFITSKFNYCTIVWMFNDMTANTKLKCTFEKALRLLCKGSESHLEKLRE